VIARQRVQFGQATACDKPRLTMMLSNFLACWLATAALFAVATANDHAAPCCVCFDDCESSVTNKNALAPLPYGMGLSSSSTCSDIQRAGQVEMLIPQAFCNLLDNEEFRYAILMLMHCISNETHLF